MKCSVASLSQLKDNYNYDVSYCDYEGATYEYDYSYEDDGYDDWWEPEDRDDDKPSRPGRRKDSALIGWKVALIIASLVLVKVKNNYEN